MSYSKNPHLPRVRMEAVKFVRAGHSIREAGRHFGFHHTAIIKWLKMAPTDGRKVIPTKSSRPHNHPRALMDNLVKEIVVERLKNNRCAEVVHQGLKNRGIVISLSSIKRTLDRKGLIKKRSKWKKYHTYPPLPNIEKAGDLLQIDTIQMRHWNGSRIYIYTIIDIYSRWTYAEAHLNIRAGRSAEFVKRALGSASFRFRTIQSDHGSEFSKWFTKSLIRKKIIHRHSRVRQSNDNGHIERFNRTIQEECLNQAVFNLNSFRRAIRKYLPYYNGQRLHLGLKLKTPLEMVPSY